MIVDIRSALQDAFVFGIAVLILLSGFSNAPSQSTNQPKFQKIFNGKNLNGWDGNPDFWSVKNRVIVGQTTDDKPSGHNTFLVWKEAQPDNFELKLEFKINNHNSGIQYRSSLVDGKNWVMKGYQADIDKAGKYIGANYDEQARGMLFGLLTILIVPLLYANVREFQQLTHLRENTAQTLTVLSLFVIPVLYNEYHFFREWMRRGRVFRSVLVHSSWSSHGVQSTEKDRLLPHD